MAIRNVVSIQENMFIKLDEEGINDFLGLVREIEVHLDVTANIEIHLGHAKGDYSGHTLSGVILFSFRSL